MKSQGQELTICQSWLGQLLKSLDPTASAPGCCWVGGSASGRRNSRVSFSIHSGWQVPGLTLQQGLP